MVVMSIIVILAGIGLTMYGNSVTRAKEAVLKEDLYRMRDAIDQYYADKNKYPASLEQLVEDKYLRACPRSVHAVHKLVADGAGRTQPGTAASDPGIYDVKSGSEQVALDGTNYSDW
jgi:general secretion pathway protein G